MLLFRGRTAHSQEVQEESQRNSISRMSFGCDCPVCVSHAQRVLCRFPSLPGSARSNPWAPPQTPDSTWASTPRSLRPLPHLPRELPPPHNFFVSSCDRRLVVQPIPTGNGSVAGPPFEKNHASAREAPPRSV